MRLCILDSVVDKFYNLKFNLCHKNQPINFSWKLNNYIFCMFKPYILSIGDIKSVFGNRTRSIGETKLTKLMCHSFSFGVDARIGINFEQRRTASRFWNQFVYGWEGFKRLFCWCRKWKTPKIREIWASITISKSQRKSVESINDLNKDDRRSSALPARSEMSNEAMHYTQQDKTVIASDTNVEAEYYIRGNPVSLYCTNIASIMGGRT